MRKIGVFCGTFDPVHRGHVALAKAALETLGLEKVLLAPFGTPLGRQPEADIKQRVDLLRLAIQDQKGLELSTVNLKNGPRYAIDTVQDIKKQHPGAQVVYLIGADKASDLPTWREAARLFSICDLALYPRAGHDAAALTDFLRGHGARVHLLKGPLIMMSSGMARAKLRLLSDAQEILLPEVACEIAAEGMYQPDYDRMVRQAVSDSRFAHSKGVRRTGARLALLHGVSMQKAGVAGIVHDCAKNMELARLQAIARQGRLARDPMTLNSNALLHGLVGAQVAKTRYHISDEDILNAIRYHTTGRAGMSPLELTVFVADAIEPGRDYPGVAQIRQEAKLDLRLAALTSLTGTAEFVRKKGGQDSPLTLEAIHDLNWRIRQKPMRKGS